MTRNYRLSALPVIDGKGVLVGLISEGDQMRRVSDSEAPRRSWGLELIAGADQSTKDFIKARSPSNVGMVEQDVNSMLTKAFELIGKSNRSNKQILIPCKLISL